MKFRQKDYIRAPLMEQHLARVAKDLLMHQWEIQDEMGRDDGIHVYAPEEWGQWIRKGPCPGCPCEGFCDRICSLRARWWDDCLREARRYVR